jgi:hypothetical protein
MKSALKEPFVGNAQEICLQVGDHGVSFLRRKLFTGKILSSYSHNVLLLLISFGGR